MASAPEHTTTGTTPTYHGLPVEPVPGHPDIFATAAALAAITEMGGTTRTAMRLFLSWAATPSTTPVTRSTSRSDDGSRMHVLVYDRRGPDDGAPGVVVSLAAEAKADDAPDCAALPLPARYSALLPAISWTEAAEAGVLVDAGPHARRLGIDRDVTLSAAAWKAVIVEHDDAVATVTPEERQRLVALINAVPRGGYPAEFAVNAPDGAPVLLVASLDRHGDLVVRLAEAEAVAVVLPVDEEARL